MKFNFWRVCYMSEEMRLEQTRENYESALEAIDVFLSSADGSSFNICAQLYELICSVELSEQPKLFEQSILLYEEIESSESLDVPISEFEARKSTLKDQYGDLVNSFIDFFVQQRYSCDEFYKHMWETLQNDIFFPNKAAKVFAFYYVLIDRRVPYFELTQGYLMSNESFRALRKKHSEVLRKVRYILSTEMQQKTERCSLLLKEMGIDIPDSDAPVEVVNEYEKKLIILVETLKYGDKGSVSSIEEILSKLQNQVSE